MWVGGGRLLSGGGLLFAGVSMLHPVVAALLIVLAFLLGVLLVGYLFIGPDRIPWWGVAFAFLLQVRRDAKPGGAGRCRKK